MSGLGVLNIHANRRYCRIYFFEAKKKRTESGTSIIKKVSIRVVVSMKIDFVNLPVVSL